MSMSSSSSPPPAGGSRGPTPPASGSRGATPPPGGGVAPLVIGKSFLKQYYQVLSTSPENIRKFYKPFSVLSQGEGSVPSAPSTLSNSYNDDSLKLKDRLTPVEGARFELGHGAIDAQESVGGGVLLVVTGHMVLESQGLRRMFCHTFFLNPSDLNAKKRTYYIHNDVLRFLHHEELGSLAEKAEEEESKASSSTSPAPPVAEAVEAPEKERAPSPAPVEEPAPVVDKAKEVSVEETKQVSLEEPKEEPAPPQSQEHKIVHGVEETKEEPLVEVEPPPPKPVTTDGPTTTTHKEKSKKDKRSRSRGRNKSRSSSPNEGKKSNAKPKPNSWASLVASGGAPTGGGGGGQVKSKPPKDHKTSGASPSETKDSTTEPPATSTAKESKQQQQQQQQQQPSRSMKRDPENTLVVKNISDSTKEADVRAVFEPLCAPSKAKILGITVAGHRGLAFVDYDSPGPVALALEKQKNERFRINNRNLDVEQKSLDRVKRSGSQRGGYRSGSPGNGGRYRDRKSGRGGDRQGRGGRGGR